MVVVPQIPPRGDGWDRCPPLQALQRRCHFTCSLNHRVHHSWRWVDWPRWGYSLKLSSSSLGWNLFDFFKTTFSELLQSSMIYAFAWVQSDSLFLGSFLISMGGECGEYFVKWGVTSPFSLGCSVWEREREMLRLATYKKLLHHQEQLIFPLWCFTVYCWSKSIKTNLKMSEGHLTKVCISNIGLTVLYLLSIIATIMMISLQNLSLKDLF